MILRTRGGGNVEMRAADLSSFIGSRVGLTETGGVAVNSSTVAGVPAATEAVRVAAQSVAVLCLGVYRGEGVDRQRVRTTWQARLFAGQPNEQQTMYGFKETVEESLSFRGNAYVWKIVDPRTNRVVEWYALHPDQVQPMTWDRGRRYSVTTGYGYIDPFDSTPGTYTLTQDQILHIRGFGEGGTWVAPSPVQRFAAVLGTSLAKVSHESSMFARGAGVKLAVTYPDSMTPEKARTWRDLFRETYEGPQNAGKTAVLGGGATIQTIGLTQADAQFIESMQFSIADIARIFNVPASLIGGGEQSKAGPLTPEHEQERWLRYGLGPRLSRIESALAADHHLFGPGSSTRPLFDTDDVVRGDVLARETMDHQQIQDGRVMVDEWRASKGLPPLPGGVGSIPQITPVGGGANPVQVQPAPTAPTTAPDPTA